MTAGMWGFVALRGIALVVSGEALRARRTRDFGCPDRFFVPPNKGAAAETIRNRSGSAVLAVGVVAALI